MIEYFTLQILKVPQSKLPLTDVDVNQQVLFSDCMYCKLYRQSEFSVTVCLWLSSSFCYLEEMIQHLLPRSFRYFYLRWILFPFVSYACTIYPQFWWFNYISNFVYKKANNAIKIVSLKLFELLTIDYWQII